MANINIDIKMNISVNDEGDSNINNFKINNNKVLLCKPNYIVRKSNSKDGSLYFKQETGFQDIIEKGENIIVFYKQNKYIGQISKQELGKITGLTRLYKENNINEDDKLKIELLVDKEPLEMYIEKIEK